MQLFIRTRTNMIKSIDITIESPKDSLRHGKDWIQKMAHDYGYIEDTIGVDGDQLDVFVGPNPNSECLFIIQQNKADGQFDEHKVMYGFNNMAEAKEAYHANYPANWDGFRHIQEIPLEEFWDWYEEELEPMETENRKNWTGNRVNRGADKYGSPKENQSFDKVQAKQIKRGDTIVYLGQKYMVKDIQRGSYTLSFNLGSRFIELEHDEEIQKVC